MHLLPVRNVLPVRFMPRLGFFPHTAPATIMSGLLGACVSTTSHVVELALPYLIPTPPAGSEKRFCGERLNAEMKMVIVRLTRIEALSAAELRFYPMSATTTHV